MPPKKRPGESSVPKKQRGVALIISTNAVQDSTHVEGQTVKLDASESNFRFITCVSVDKDQKKKPKSLTRVMGTFSRNRG